MSASQRLRERLEAIAEGAEGQTEELDLTDYKLGDDGAVNVRKGFAGGEKPLRRLSLQRCGFGPVGFREMGLLLMEGEGDLCQIESIALGGNLLHAEADEEWTLKQQELATAKNCLSVLEEYMAELEKDKEEAHEKLKEPVMVQIAVLTPQLPPAKAAIRKAQEAFEIRTKAFTDLRKVFLEGVELCKTLRSLDLSNCHLGDDNLDAICDVLAKCDSEGAREPSKLEHLGVASNNLGPASGKSLSRMLAVNEALLSIDLKANSLGADGAAELAVGLVGNKGRLRRLDISQNAVNLVGARELATCFAMREFTFVIRLKRPRGTTVGLVFDSDMTNRLTVIGLEMRGLIELWNETNPSDAVCKGDLIAGVNDKDLPEDMVDEMRAKDTLEITVTRPTGGLEHLDVTHNAVTLHGVEEIREMLGRPQEGSNYGWQLCYTDGVRRKICINAA